TTATTSLRPLWPRASRIGVPAVPDGSPSSFDRVSPASGPRTQAEQWWRASQWTALASSTTARASSSEPTRRSQHSKTDRRSSIEAVTGPRMVRYTVVAMGAGYDPGGDGVRWTDVLPHRWR